MSSELTRSRDGIHGSFRTSTSKHQNSVAIRTEVKRHNAEKTHLGRLMKLMENVSDQHLRSSLMVSLHSLRGAVPEVFAATNAEVTNLVEQLYSSDVNKAASGDVTLNLQYFASSSQTGSGTDYASQKLFSYVNEAKLFARPTFSRFIALLNNYVETTGTAESVPTGEITEQNAFVDEIFKTSIFSLLSNFLVSKGYYTSSTSFKDDLKMMWFGLFTRTKGPLDSSGFEHIFLGEIHGGKISGFHNWVRFYLLEKEGKLNYLSYSADGPWTSYPDVYGFQFKWSNYLKSIGSMFIGSSPEFDLAVFTLCYVTRPDSLCTVTMGGKTLKIQTYTWANSSYGNGKRYVGSSYPVV